MIYLISSIIAFSALILIHEGGHFIVAKSVGMKVNEFALGMGPKIFGIQKGETLYSLRAIPIGGFIRPEGEDEESDHPRAFGNKPLWARTAVVAAGPISNFLLAFVIIIALLTFAGVPLITIADLGKTSQTANSQLLPGDIIIRVNDKPVYILEELQQIVSKENSPSINITVIRNQQEIKLNVPTVYSDILNQYVLGIQGITVGDATANNPAAKAGMQQGDIITKVNNQNIYVFDELVQTVNNSKGSSIVIGIVRDGKPMDIPITPMYSDSLGRYIIGIYPFSNYGIQRCNFSYTQNFKESLFYSTSLSKQLMYGLKKLFSGQMSKSDVAGPVRIVSLTGEVAKIGIYSFIHFIALLSLSLGIFNLFPLPALDGGRLLFFGIEAVRGKPVDQQKEAMVHFVGFVLLMMLMVFVTFNDIKMLIGS